MHLSDLPIIELDNIDSTNNYAMRLIDADKAQPGLTIAAKRQAAGKGQRGKTWHDSPGQSILMSIIVKPDMPINEQFLFNAAITLAIINVLEKLNKNWHLRIKWPNDIIINDKKAGGILIENVLRGSNWVHSVIGVGINVNQGHMPPTLPHSTSLRIVTGEIFDIRALREQIRLQILANTVIPPATKLLFRQFNDKLYKRGQRQMFSNSEGKWDTTIIGVKPDGTLEVELADGTKTQYYHGQVMWEWEK